MAERTRLRAGPFREEASPERVHRDAVNESPNHGFDPTTRAVGSDTHREIEAARGGGSPLSEDVRAAHESRLGIGLDRVRVHTDRRADVLSRQLEANAFTLQNDVFFRRGTFSPGTSAGDQLLAHELTHVAQYGGESRPTSRATVSSPNDPSEREAAVAAGPGLVSRSVDGETVHRSPDEDSLRVESDRMIRQYVEGFDIALGKWLADHPLAMEGGKLIVLGIHKILSERFKGSTQSEGEFLISALGPANKLASMPGAPVARTLADVKAIAESTSPGSIRTMMSLTYAAIKGGVLTQGMHEARKESETGGGSQRARDQAVKQKWGLAGESLRQTDVGSAAEPATRNYFNRKDRISDQGRLTRGGEASGLASLEARTIGQAEFAGITLSLDELTTVAGGDQLARQAATGPGGYDALSEPEKRALMIDAYADVELPAYTPGFAVYRVDPTTPEAQEAAKRRGGVVAGLSGSTDMYLHFAQHLGLTKSQMRLVRLTAMGEMLARRDHSFYEVVVAGNGYGLTDINPEKGVAAYEKIPPLKKKEIRDGTKMTLPSDYARGVTGKSGQATLKQDLDEVRSTTEWYAEQIEQADAAGRQTLGPKWQDYYRSVGYRWAHDRPIQAAINRINRKLGPDAGVTVALATRGRRNAAREILNVVQTHSGDPTRVVPEVHATKAWKDLVARVGTIPANQVLAAYVTQYVGSAGLIIPSVQFAAEIEAIESGAKPLPPIDEVGDRANQYAHQVWPEAKSELHRRAQRAEQEYADKVAALDQQADDYAQRKQALDDEYKRSVATGAAETWKRVQAHIAAAESLTATERYAIYTYTQGSFYKELNKALSRQRKLTTKERAVALAATVGLRKLPPHPGPVFRAQSTGSDLRRKSLSQKRIDDAKKKWKVGKKITHKDFLSTFAHEGGPKEFMDTDQGSHYDLVVRIERVKTGRWTLLLSAAEAIAAGMNPEHEGEVTFPPGATFEVSRPLDVSRATSAQERKDRYCVSVWRETTPDAAAPQGTPLPAIGDDQVPAQYQPAPAVAEGGGGGAPPPPPPQLAVPPPPPMRGAARSQAVAQADPVVQDQVALIVAPPNIGGVPGGDQVQLPEPDMELANELLADELVDGAVGQ